MIKVVSNKEQTATGPLPITFNSDGTPLDDYKLYGTADGAGVETESGEPTGYKLPMTVTSGEESTTTPIYIGSSKLGEEEYVDYGEQKVYKRTENLFDKDAKDTNKGYVARKYLGSDGSYQEGYSPWSISEYIDVEPNVKYQYQYNAGYNEIYLCLYDENKQFISSIKYGNFGYTIAFITTAYTKFVRVSILNLKVNETQLIKSDSVPTSYTPYYDIQTLPVPLPLIPTYQGENTLSCSEELGEVSQITYVGPVEETITKIMRTEDDGQGNVTEHVLYKEGS